MPYREAAPLTDLIPPDRRRAKTFALIGIGMVAGAGLLWLVQDWFDRPVPISDHSPLTRKDVEAVVLTKHASLREKCWSARPELTYGEVDVLTVIDRHGTVISTTATGTPAALSRCVDAEVRRWSFPASGGASVEVNIPFKFRRELD